MISITRIEELGGYLRRYRVAINREGICTFVHDYRDGLATCLRQAASAVDKERKMRGYELLELFLQESEEYEKGER